MVSKEKCWFTLTLFGLMSPPNSWAFMPLKHSFHVKECLSLSEKEVMVSSSSSSMRRNRALLVCCWGRNEKKKVDDEELFETLLDFDKEKENIEFWQKQSQKINVETTKRKLEESHRQSFLKSKPRKLPYEEASKWVQFNLGADTKEEFDDLVANGNVRTPYIPKQPETFYKDQGTWISWDHFLHHDHKNDNNENNS